MQSSAHTVAPVSLPSGSGEEQHCDVFWAQFSISFLFEKWELPLHYDLSPYKLRFSTIYALMCCEEVLPHELVEVAIYTDGSFAKSLEKAAWSFAVIYNSSCKQQFMGFLCSKLIVDGLGWCDHGSLLQLTRELIACNEGSLHVDCVGNNAAERVAIVWALLYALQLNINCLVTISTDSQLCIDLLFHRANSTVNSGLVTIMRNLYLIASQVMCISIVKVEAHANHPYNELADVLAKSAYDSTLPLPHSSLGLLSLSRTELE